MTDTLEPDALLEKPPSEKRVSLLLVDDQPANLLALEAILQDLGHDLVQARSGEEALKRLLDREFALVLLDVQMPGLDGFETAKLMRGREESWRTPIIFLTAFESDRFPVEQAYSLGAVDYLVKPLVPVIVRAKVAGFVDLYQKTQQVKRQAERIRQIERREFEERLAQENAALRERVRLAAFGRDVAQTLVQSDTVPAMLRHCAEAMVRHLHGAFARIWTLATKEKMLELQASAGLYTHLNGPHSRVPVGQFKIGLIAQERKPHLTNAVGSDPRVNDPEWAKREGMVAFAGYPLLVEDRLVGVMAMFAREPLSDATLEAMASVADGIAVGVERKQAQERLREGREWLRVTLASIGDAVIATDTAGRVTYLNPVAEDLTGWTQDDAQGRPLEDVFHILHEQTRQPVENPVAKVLREGVVVGLGNHTVLIARSGAEKPIDDSAAPIENEAGSTVGVVLTFRDVTEQRRAENEARESDEKLRLLADTIPQLAWMARPDGHIFWYNRRWYEYTGATPAQMAGWGWQAVHDPAVLPQVLERWQGSIATGQPFDMVFPLRGADGQFRPFLTRVNPLQDQAGRILYWFGTNTDISEQKRAADASRFLADASAALAAVVDYESTLGKVARLAVPFFADWCAVDLAEADGSLRRLAVVHVDPSKVGQAKELHRRYPPRPDDPHGPAHVLRTNRPEMAEEITESGLLAAAQDQEHLRMLREFGLRSFIAVPLAARGKPLGVLTFITSESGRQYGPADLTLAEDLAHRAAVAIDNARLYAESREADRRKDEFLATLAHELRNPMAPLHNALQILKMPNVDATIAERTREMMERQVHQLVRLVDDLLDVSRVMRGKIELRKERVELATVVARAVETAQPLIEAQGHELTISLPPESLPLHADAVRLTQVVGNLLTNAAKYTEAKGRIWLTAHREGDEAVLGVRDQGIGIAPDMLPRVFELFVQVDHAATRSQGGLGIGLTLVKNLVEMHHGTVEAHSDGLGKGSAFVVRLPLTALGPEAPGERDNGEPQADTSSPGQRLLVVDDNEDAADSLAMLLRLQGHEVRVAHDGPAALEMAKVYRPDMIFLDIGMPGMDGYEVARQLRRQPELKNVVLAALTGWGQQEDRRRSAEAGFDHHLVKPPEPKVLEGLLADLKRARG